MEDGSPTPHPRVFRWAPAAIAWAILVGALLLPPSGVGLPLCPSRLLSGAPCPGCGLTRSVTNLVRGDVAQSWRYNPFGIVALALALWFALSPCILGASVRERISNSRLARGAGLIVLVLFVAHGAWRAWSWWAASAAERPEILP
jgi:hypothetical protein